MLDYIKLKNIRNIDENNIYFKDGRKIHSDNFTYLNVFQTQKYLEEFDKKALNLLLDEPLEEHKLINIERDIALLSLDKSKILSYCKKYGIKPDEDLTEKEFWAGIHYAILGLNSATKEQKDRSRKWLLLNNFSI